MLFRDLKLSKCMKTNIKSSCLTLIKAKDIEICRYFLFILELDIKVGAHTSYDDELQYFTGKEIRSNFLKFAF